MPLDQLILLKKKLEEIDYNLSLIENESYKTNSELNKTHDKVNSCVEQVESKKQFYKSDAIKDRIEEFEFFLKELCLKEYIPIQKIGEEII